MLRGWAHKAASELQDKLVVGRLLAGREGAAGAAGRESGPELSVHNPPAQPQPHPYTHPHTAGEDLQAVEPLHVMELLNRRASSAAAQADEATVS